MRLSLRDRELIRNVVADVYGSDARVCLFGSRTDDSLRGGDIDLLIELPRPGSDDRRKSLTLAARLQMQLGDQPIDIVVIDPGTPLDPIHHEARATAQPL